MTEPAGRIRFWPSYRQQYRQVSASKTGKAWPIIRPVSLVIAVTLFPRWPVVSIILGGLAVLLIAGSIIWSRKQRHPPSTHAAGNTESGPEPG